VRKIHYIISAALEQAVPWRHLGVNPAALAIAPTANHTEPDPPSAEEAAAVISAAWGDSDWGLLQWVVMITGMRRGEISALRWQHVDLVAGTLIVQRANAQPRSGITEKATKTRQQRRVAIDPQTVGLLLDTVNGGISGVYFLASHSGPTCSSSRRPRTPPLRTVRAHSAIVTGTSRSSWACAARACTRYATTQLPN
jgi:integrase